MPVRTEKKRLDWRETDPILVDRLDQDTGELLDLIGAEFPFERVGDGTLAAWLQRAERIGVISAADRRHLMSVLRNARAKR